MSVMESMSEVKYSLPGQRKNGRVAAEELPDELALTMGINRQHCRVMWRRQKGVGVRFSTPK